jgi:hypothetical protein
MKFPLAQEVSRHVRDKVCKFLQSPKTPQSSTCTITSSDQLSSVTSGAFALIASDSINFQSLESGSESDRVPSGVVAGAELDLIETNFAEVLSPASFQMSSSTDNAFGMMIGEVRNEEQAVEVSFACKLCEFR